MSRELDIEVDADTERNPELDPEVDSERDPELDRDPDSVRITLTPEQHKLFDDHPTLVEKAARAVVRRLGTDAFTHLTWKEMLSIGTVAAMEATTTHDPTLGTYWQWGFFAVMHAVLKARRKERTEYAKIKSLIRASAMHYFGETGMDFDLGFETERSISGKLTGYSNPLIALAMMEVATYQPATGGEHEVVEIEAATRAGNALRLAVPDPNSIAYRVIWMRFVDRMPLTEIAGLMGVPKPGYKSFTRWFHRVLEGIRDKLAAHRIEDMPPWREDASGHVFDEK